MQMENKILEIYNEPRKKIVVDIEPMSDDSLQNNQSFIEHYEVNTEHKETVREEKNSEGSSRSSLHQNSSEHSPR